MNDQNRSNTAGVRRLETGIPGLDALTKGGFPSERATLACGTSGSGKTIMACQFLIEGIRKHDQAGVFVALEERPADVQRNMTGLGWDVQKHIDDGKWLFVDATMHGPDDEQYLGGDFDLQPLTDRICQAVQKIGATRVSIDSMASLLNRLPDIATIRREMTRVIQALRDCGATTVVTAERLHEAQGEISRFGVEEYVVDNVVILRNRSDDTRRRRTIEVLKMRGGAHNTGEFPFTISSNGITAIPVGTISLASPSSAKRIASGSNDLDKMCGGGFFQDSVTIVAGATGTGKTLTAATFLKGAAESNEKALFFGFEESRSQLFRNCSSWGIDLEKYTEQGLVQMHCQFPESASLEDHLNEIRRGLTEFKPLRIVVDSISALQRIGSDHSFREFVIGLTSLVKKAQVAGLYTTTSEQLIGGSSVTGQHISTLTDAIIMLRYVERDAELTRGMTVLKMRGSPHDKSIREFAISEEGLGIGKPLHGAGPILSNDVEHLPNSD